MEWLKVIAALCALHGGVPYAPVVAAKLQADCHAYFVTCWYLEMAKSIPAGPGAITSPMDRCVAKRKLP